MGSGILYRYKSFDKCVIHCAFFDRLQVFTIQALKCYYFIIAILEEKLIKIGQQNFKIAYYII